MGMIEAAPTYPSRQRSGRERYAVLPSSLPPRGLGRALAASYIGVGATKFDQMVSEGTMPKPRVNGSRKLWDRSEIDAAFSGLPHDGDEGLANPWNEALD